MSFNEKKKVWSLRYTPGNSAADDAVNAIASENGISRVSAKLIYNRGYCTKDSVGVFLNPTEEGFHDPYLMADMDRAVARIAEALAKNEKITVYGDYDVDGVTSVTLIYLYLKSLGADIDYYIPSRSKEGYGLSPMALDALKEKGTQFIVTVDTGITANEEVEYAKSLGIEMVITDHHECHGELPKACAVVNPHRPDCQYPFKELAGVGVIFKLVCAYEAMLCQRGERAEGAVGDVFRKYADLAAIGTVADVMPLIDENRIIVKEGLSSLNDTEREGLAALIEAASNPQSDARVGADNSAARKRKINAGFIGFALAPRINAAGRISTAEKAVELLLSTDPRKSTEKAQELCEINLRRQKEENAIAEAAYKTIEETHDFENDRVIVLNDDNWQQGIIGIVSSRITEKYGLPSILISFDGATKGSASLDDCGKGSGRSIKGMNLVDALDHCKDLLVRFGGHELAAGLTVMRCNIDEFKKRINDYARENLTEDLSCIRYVADCALEADEIGMELAEELTIMEPFGVANPTPVFMVNGFRITRIISMGAGKHTKLILNSGGREFQAVFFGTGASSLDVFVGEEIDLMCQLGINEFRGHKSVQLIVQDIRLSEKLAAEYRDENERYERVASGASFRGDEDILPSRADIAEIYKLLRKESTGGRTLFNYRAFRVELADVTGRGMSLSKIRFALKILNDINVCRIDDMESFFSVEINRNAAKTNIELSETYRRLCAQCDG